MAIKLPTSWAIGVPMLGMVLNVVSPALVERSVCAKIEVSSPLLAERRTHILCALEM